MTRSTSLKELQHTVYDTLNTSVDITTTHGCDVYVYVPEDAWTACPYLTVSDPTEVPWDRFGNLGQRCTFTIHIWSEAKGNLETYDILGHVNDSLDLASLSITGYSLAMCQNTFSSVIRDPDGVHYHGVMNFTAYLYQ